MLEEYSPTIKYIKLHDDAADALISILLIKYDVTERYITRETLS